ncbi:MAG: nitrate- and nitrite sensing domain-containing protein, partial [Gammaproteobacteria bacterium]|nr:nitrate- and nitrite sensing domain-containing protein [Gammaproteobacteria bacterium]
MNILSLIDNMKISVKVLLMLLVPLTALTVLAIQTANTQKQILNVAAAADKSIAFAEILDQLAHNFAVERGLTAGFLASGGKQGAEKVKEQRAKADQASRIFIEHLDEQGDNFYDAEMNDHLQLLRRALSQRQTLRNAVDVLAKQNGAFVYYSNINKLALESIEWLVKDIDNTQLASAMNAYVAMLSVKERAGQERGALNGVFTNGEVSAERFKLISRYITEQQSKQQVFERYASAEQRQRYDLALPPETIVEVMAMRASFTSRGEKMGLLTELQGLLGYGGLIHNFKNYVLSSNTKYLPRIEAGFKQADLTINNYSAIAGVTSVEKKALNVIKKTFQKYQQGGITAKHLFAAGESSQTVDRAIKVSDGPALAALHRLRRVSGVNAGDWFTAATARITKLKKLADQMAVDARTIAQQQMTMAASNFSMIVKALSGLLIFTLLFGTYVGFNLVRNIKAIAKTMTEVEATGDLSKRANIKSKDEVGQMALAFNTLMDAQQTAIQEVGGVVSALAEGELNQRVTANLNGDLDKLKQQLNTSLDSVSTTINAISEVMAGIRAGDFQGRIRIEAKGEFATLQENINASQDRLESAISSIYEVTAAQQNGDMSKRAQGHYEGQLQDLKEAINASASSVGTAVNEISAVMLAMRAGDFTQRIEADLKGELRELKDNINLSFNQLDTAMADIVHVASALKDGDMSQRVMGDYAGQLGILKISFNDSTDSISTAFAEVGEVMSALRQGDFSLRVRADLKGELSALKENINLSLDQLAAAISDIVNVASALKEGDMSQRVMGDYAGQLGVLKNAFNESTDSINTAFSEVGGVMRALRDGNFSKRMETELKGELRQLQENANDSLVRLESAMTNIVQVATEQGKGDLCGRVEGDYAGQLGILKDAINGSATNLAHTFSNIQEMAMTVTTGTNEISQGNTDLSQRTEEQASSLEEVSSSMEEMTAAVGDSAGNASVANKHVESVKAKAVLSGQVAEKTITAMSVIRDSSKKIGDIIGVIDGIAFQTNLLALNAAVEAARAGEQG